MEKNLILVIEDVQVCQDYIKLLFDSNPYYKIIYVRNGRGALGKIKTHMDKIALILLDLRLPDISGDELFRIFQANPKLKEIPIIFQSGFNLDASCNLDKLIQDTDSITKVEMLSKPFTKEQLFAKIAAVLGKSWLKSQPKIAKHKSNKVLGSTNV